MELINLTISRHILLVLNILIGIVLCVNLVNFKKLPKSIYLVFALLLLDVLLNIVNFAFDVVIPVIYSKSIQLLAIILTYFIFHRFMKSIN